MLQDYKIIILGENHVNFDHARVEANIIIDFKPDYILYEGFADHSEEEIRNFIDNFISKYNKSKLEIPIETQRHFILLKAMEDSNAKIFGCDLTALQKEQDKYEITQEDIFRGEEYVEEKRKKWFEINTKRSKYMALKIIEFAKKGNTLAIIGKGHLDEVVELLKDKDIEPEYVLLE